MSRVAVGSGGLKAACLLVDGVMSLPSLLLGLRHLALVSTSRLVRVELGPGADSLNGRLQNGACQHQCLCDRTSSPIWLPPESMSPG